MPVRGSAGQPGLAPQRAPDTGVHKHASLRMLYTQGGGVGRANFNDTERLGVELVADDQSKITSALRCPETCFPYWAPESTNEH